MLYDEKASCACAYVLYWGYGTYVQCVCECVFVYRMPEIKFIGCVQMQNAKHLNIANIICEVKKKELSQATMYILCTKFNATSEWHKQRNKTKRNETFLLR